MAALKGTGNPEISPRSAKSTLEVASDPLPKSVWEKPLVHLRGAAKTSLNEAAPVSTKGN
jgi:hypothetical protein